MIARRIPGNRPLNTLVIIVFGGETEAIYFENLEAIRHDLSIKPGICSNDPERILSEAIRLKEKYRKSTRYNNIETWIVIDKDHFDIDNVITKALKQKIKVAYSNVCFEVWYALHFQYTTAQNNAKQWERLCKKYLKVPSYSKTKNYNEKLTMYTQTAIANAKRLENFHSAQDLPSKKNPYTSVYKLVDFLLEK